MTWASDARQSDVAAICIAVMDASRDWQRSHASEGMIVWTTCCAPPSVRPLAGGAGVLIGRLHPRVGLPLDDAAHPPKGRTGRFEARAHDISRRFWGGYVAILQDDGDGSAAAFRDPSAGLDAICWTPGPGVQIVASHMAPLPSGVSPQRPFLNWDRIALFVANPSATATTSLFDDVTIIEPGDLVRLDPPNWPTSSIWSPVTFAGDPIDDEPYAAAELRAQVDHCVGAMIGTYDRVLLELSGGLDSSIIAGSIKATGHAAHVVEGVNFGYRRTESNEAAYAQAVADRLGVPLTTFVHEPQALDESTISEMSKTFQPTVNGIIARVDRDEIARLQATHAQALVSGQGGDAVFFQMPSALIAADLIARDGWRAVGSTRVADVARRARLSVWHLARDVLRRKRGPHSAPELCSSLVPPDLAADAAQLTPHWVAQARAARLPPGKTLQILAATTHLGNEAPRRRREVADVIFPLFAQPVLEHCLRIPAPTLAGGNYDRAFARQTFADRIPESVLRRRAKGMTTVYFAKVIAASLPFLKPYLLEGCLCAAGVLDRRALEQALDHNHLIWHAKPTDILWAAAAEGWVRHWQTQVPDSPRAARR